jgi:hypothetical protein
MGSATGAAQPYTKLKKACQRIAILLGVVGHNLPQPRPNTFCTHWSKRILLILKWSLDRDLSITLDPVGETPEQKVEKRRLLGCRRDARTTQLAA